MSAAEVLFATRVHQALADHGVEVIDLDKAGGYAPGVHVYPGGRERCTVAVRGPNARIVADAVTVALTAADYRHDRVANHMVRAYGDGDATDAMDRRQTEAPPRSPTWARTSGRTTIIATGKP